MEKVTRNVLEFLMIILMGQSEYLPTAFISEDYGVGEG